MIMMAENNTANLAQDFVRIHRAITRGLTVGVARGEDFMRAGFPNPGIRQGYAFYIQSLLVVLKAHHMGEDEIAFPSLRKKLPSVPYERLSSDHQEIEALLESIGHAAANLTEEGSMVDLTLLVDGLRRIAAIWIAHIPLEETHFSQTALAAVMDPEEQDHLGMALAKHGQEHATPGYLAMPFVLYNLNAEDRAGMAAALPSMIMEELVPKVWKDQWAPMRPFLLD
jgi:hypothetical protein